MLFSLKLIPGKFESPTHFKVSESCKANLRSSLVLEKKILPLIYQEVKGRSFRFQNYLSFVSRQLDKLLILKSLITVNQSLQKNLITYFP